MIRPATLSDADAMAAVWMASALDAYAAIFPPDAPKPTLTDLAASQRADLEEPENAGFVYEEGSQVVGIVTVGAWPGVPSTGRLARLYVEPSCWKRGIGASLYRRAEAELRRRNFGAAQLWVLRENTRARSMYERRGWKLTDETTMTYAPAGIDDVQYRLTF